jgi:hypothetical protein
LAAKLGLPEGSTNADCLAAVKRLKARKGKVSLDEAKATLARLELKHGLTPNPDGLEQLIAKDLGNDRYLLGGRVLTGAELEAEMRKQYDEDHALDGVLGAEQLSGAEIDKAATALLASRGIWEPTADQYLDACKAVGAQ